MVNIKIIKKLNISLSSLLFSLVIIALIILIFARERYWANQLDALLWDTIGPITLTYDEKGNVKSSEDGKRMLNALRTLVVVKAKEVAESQTNPKLPVLYDPYSNSHTTKELEINQILNKPSIKAIILYLLTFDNYDLQYRQLKSVTRIYEKHRKKGVEFIFVLEGEYKNTNEVDYIVKKLGKKYKTMILWDKNFEVSPYTALPQILIINRDSKICYRQEGYIISGKIPPQLEETLLKIIEEKE